MKAKHLIIVSMLLAIMAIGAVSASEDIAADDAVSDDTLAVDGDVDVAADTNDEENQLSADSADEDDSLADIEDDVKFWVEKDYQFNTTCDDDLEKNFASVSIKEGYDGSISIEDDEGYSLFDKDLDDFDAQVDGEYRIFNICLNNITNLGKFLSMDEFTLTFTDANDYDNYADADFSIFRDGDVVTFGEEGPDFDVDVEENFDVYDPDATVICIDCPENVAGAIWIEMDDGDDRGTKKFKRLITDADWDSEINITVSYLGIEGNVEHYIFWVYYYPEGTDPDWNDDDDLDDHRIADDEHADGRDFSAFWIEIPLFSNYFSEDPIVSFCCADETEGTVVVDVYKFMDDDSEVYVGEYFKNIADNDEKMLYWNATELNLELGNDYSIHVSCGNWSDKGRYSYYHPVIFNEVSYLECDDEERITVVTIELPSDVGGSIHLEINGTMVYLDTLMFDEKEDGTELSKLYWEHPGWGHDNTDLKTYYINNLNLKDLQDPYSGSYEFSEGVYNITVILYVDFDSGTVTYNRQGNVTVTKPKSEEKDGITIKIYDQQTYSVYEDEWAIAEITAPDGADGTIVVTVSGIDNPVFEQDLDDFDEGYVICPSDLKLDKGDYEITVAYWEGDTQILNNTALISFDYNGEGIMVSHVPFVMKYNDNDDIEIFFATPDVEGEVYIIIDGVEYYRTDVNSTMLEFDDEEGYFGFRVSLEDFSQPIEFGDYFTVEIFYEGADGTKDYDVHIDLSIAPNTPSIWIPDWDVSIRDDFIICAYPSGDDSENIRIVLTIGGEVYLNATVDEMGLILRVDEDEKMFYGVTAYQLNKELEIGTHYDDVIAYYYSDNFNATSLDDEGWDELYIAGMLYEVEYNYTGPVISVFCNRDGGEIQIFIEGRDDPIIHPITAGDKGSFINWDLAELNLLEVGSYGISVKYDDGEDIFGGDLMVVNNSNFRVRTYDALIFFNDANVFWVFCPQGSEGKNIELYSRDGDLIAQYQINDEAQGNYVVFTLDDLNITEPGWYQINATVDGEQIGDELYEFTIFSAMEFSANGVVTLPQGEEESELMKIVGLNLPYGYGGNVIITIDGTEVFNKDLTDIHSMDFGEFMHYDIYTSDLDDVDEGTYRVVVSFEGIEESRFITFAQRNVNRSDNNVTLDMFSLNCPVNWWNSHFAIIEAPEGVAVDLEVYINGELSDKLDYWNENNWDDHTVLYYIAYIPDEFEPGTYNVTVVCKADGESIAGNATLTLFENPEIFVMWSNYPDCDEVEYGLDSDSMVHIYPNGDESNFRIIVMIGDKIYFNATRDELDLTPNYNGENELFYTIGPANFTKAIAPGHYDDVIAFYIGDYAEARGDDGDSPTYVDITGNPLDPDFSIEISNVAEEEPITVTVRANEAFSGDVTVNVAGFDVSVHIEDGYGVNDTTDLTLPAGDDYTAILTYDATVSFKEDTTETKFNVTAKSGEGNETPSEGGNATPSGSSSSQQGQGTASQPAAQTQAPVNDIIKLTLKKVKVKKSAKKLVLRATLKINGKKVKGKIVRFKFNGKTYKAKTNKKGIAKVTIKKAVLKKLKVGKKIKYQVSYGGKTVKKTVKVKK